MSSAVRYIESRLLGDSYFLYTAFAPMQPNTKDKELQKIQADHILVKIGISTVPMNRILSVHMNSPFRVAFAAFTNLWATKRKAEKIEVSILEEFRPYKTRGEWLMIPNTEAEKKRFAERSKVLISRSTQRPVEWRRVTGAEIALEIMKKVKKT